MEHDGGWAYKSGGVFSEPFASHEDAVAAAKRAAAEQEMPGKSETIEYEDEKGTWHVEFDAWHRPPRHRSRGGLRGTPLSALGLPETGVGRRQQMAPLWAFCYAIASYSR